MRYIDLNAVQARLASNSALYPYGSASLYANRRRPRWLHTNWADARMDSPSPDQRSARYTAVYGHPLTDVERHLVEARIRAPAALEDELDDLVAAAPAAVRAWMERKVRLADQTKPGVSYVDGATVLRRIAAAEAEQGEWRCVPARRQRRSAWPIVRAGLLRHLAGMTFQDIATWMDLPQSAAQRRVRQHDRLTLEDPRYAEGASRLATDCLAMLRNP